MSIKAYDIPIPRKRPDGSFDPRELESWMRNVYKKFSAIENFVNAVLSAGDGITLTFDSTSNTLEIKTTVEMPAAAALGDMVYADGADSWNRLTGNTSSTKKYLAMTGDGTNANTPSWETVAATSLSSMTSAELATILTDETGTGKVVFSNSPVLVTPNIGNAVGVTVNKVFITTPTTSATLTIADGKTLTCNASITITGTDSETLTLTKGLTVTTNAGTIAFGAASKTLTVEDNSLVNQDLTTDASPTFVTAKLSGLADGKIPYHVDDSTGLADTTFQIDSGGNLYNTTDGIRISGSIGALAGVFRSDAGLEVYGADAGISFLMTTNPGVTTKECFFAMGGYDSAGAIKKTGSFSSKWVDTTAGTGYGMLRFNATYAGGDSTDVAFRIFGNHGCEFFGTDVSIPGSKILRVKGELDVYYDGAVFSGNSYYLARFLNTDNTKGLNFGYDNTAVLGLVISQAANSGMAFWTHNGSWGERLRIDVDGVIKATSAVNLTSLIATSNSLTIKPTTDAVTAIQLQDKDGNYILNVDTTNNRVGVGTNAPKAAFEIYSTLANSVSGDVTSALYPFRIIDAPGAGGGGFNLLDIRFNQTGTTAGYGTFGFTALESGGAYYTLAQIGAPITPGAGNDIGGDLIFITKPVGANLSERMRITAAGNIAMGAIVSDTRLSVTGDFDGSSATGTTNSNKGLSIIKKTGVVSDYGLSDLYGVVFSNSSNNDNDYPVAGILAEGTEISTYGGGQLHFLTKTKTDANLVTRITIDKTGNLLALVGCHVGGTSDPGDNNLLVDGTGTITGAFGCNGATAQTAYASGGALAAYSTGDFGFDTEAHASALYAMVVAIRAALVANGIMS